MTRDEMITQSGPTGLPNNYGMLDGVGLDGAHRGADGRVVSAPVPTVPVEAMPVEAMPVNAEPAEDKSQIEAIASEVQQLRGEIEKLKALMADNTLQTIMQSVSEQLNTLPDAKMMRAEVAKAVEQGIAVAVENSDGASRDDVANALVSTTNHVIQKMQEMSAQFEKENAALRAEIVALREDQQEKRGIFARPFGAG